MKHFDNIPTAVLLEKLGFADPKKLAKDVNVILKEKEDYKKYIVTPSEEFSIANTRPEKITIVREAETLVRNIAILHPYKRLFGRSGDASKYVAQAKLSLKKNRQPLRDAALQMKRDLERDIQRSQDALEGLGEITAVITDNLPINLEKDSINELLQSGRHTSLSDISHSYLTGNWNDIVVYRNRISDGEVSSELFRLLGEKLYLTGDMNEAEEILLSAVELDAENGIAHSILAMIYQRKLAENSEEKIHFLAKTDFSGHISNPVTSEEQWINDGLEFVSGSREKIKANFIYHAVHSLEFWPQHGYRPDGKKNYMMNLSGAPDVSVTLSRWGLFKALIAQIGTKEWNQYKSFLERAVVSLLSFSEYGFHHHYSFSGETLKDKINLLHLVNLYSPDIASKHLKWKSESFRSEESLYLEGYYEYFRSPPVAAMFSEYFGVDTYDQLMADILEARYENEKTEMLSERAERILWNTEKFLQKLCSALNHRALIPELSVLANQYDIEQASDETDKQLALLINAIEGWEVFQQDKTWLKYRGSNFESWQVRKLLLTACLVELAANKNTAHNAELLSELVAEDRAFTGILTSFSPWLMNWLTERVLAQNPDVGGLNEDLAWLVAKTEDVYEQFSDDF
ncbi:hypothetical protein [Alteromonas confluentis]|uniref:Uncharacterized protein n=1 Tax=Alteromonas confluentis TaxID=1656094 RepID=A0A1E7ZBD2_9ALTE|nr:hypothetical protein [Alteromonas confluentis]OFC70817.1 hypothetical protein BFC18_11430 [Alteromonas confluentis]